MCPHIIRATVPQNEQLLWPSRMSLFDASKIKLVISSIFCGHVILSVRSPFNLPLLFTWQISKPHNSKTQARFTGKKIQCHTNKYHKFTLSSSHVRFSNYPEPKRKTKLKQILDHQTFAFFARNNSKEQENAGKQVAIGFFLMVESQRKVNQNQCNLRSPSMLNF